MFESRNSGLSLGGPQVSDNGVSRRSLLKYAGLGAAALGSIPLLTACGGGNAAAKELTPFSVSSFPGDSFFLDTVNLAHKDYAKHGLDTPKHLTTQSGLQAVQLMVAGALDGDAFDTMLLMAAHANGTKGKRPVLVGFRTVETCYGIVVGQGFEAPPADASFEEKMRSLKGMKVGVTSIGSGSDLQLKLALETAGMQYSDVTALAVGVTAQGITNLQQRRIDAYVTVQWTATRFVAQETEGAILLDFADPSGPEIMRNQAVVAIGVREDMAANHPELVKDWLACQETANTWIQGNRKDAADLLNSTGLGGKAPDIATAYIDHYCTAIAPKIQPMFKATRVTVDHMSSLAERFGSIKKGDITYETLVPEFARA